MTPNQIKTIKINQKKANLDDASYRLLLQNVGQVDTCKALTQEGYEDVLSVMEDLHGEGQYWRTVVYNRGRFANPRMLHKIESLFRQYECIAQAAGIEDPDLYKLPGLVARASRDRTRELSQLRPQEAWNLIESLKKIVARTEPQSHRDTEDAPRAEKLV